MIKRYNKISLLLGILGIAFCVLPFILQLTLFRFPSHLHISPRSPIFLIFEALPIIGVGLVLLGMTNHLKAKRQSTVWIALLLVLIFVHFSPHYTNPPAYLETLRRLCSIAFFLVLIVIFALPDRAKQSGAQKGIEF
jgi:hypothetical protein